METTTQRSALIMTWHRTCRPGSALARIVDGEVHVLSFKLAAGSQPVRRKSGRIQQLIKRFDTLQQPWQVLVHPYFHQHVTELVYDASVYEEVARQRLRG